MSKLAIRLLYIIAPFCIDVGFKGFLAGYFYLRFVKYTGIMGYTIIAFYICMGIAAIYLYFWMIKVIEGKNQISVIEIVKEVIASFFPYFLISKIAFTYISCCIYGFEYILYFSINNILLLLCLYGQMQLDDKLIRLMERKGIKRE